MKRDLILGLSVAALLHLTFFFGGRFWPVKPAAKPVSEDSAPVELMPLPPVQPDKPEVVDNNDQPPPDVSKLVPPMQPDVPSLSASSFVQQIEPPRPQGLLRQSISIPPQAGLGRGAAGIFDLSSLDQIPVPRLRIPPSYPFDMREQGISGDVVVGFIVDANGNVRDPYIISATRSDFEEAALEAVQKWKFKPGRKNGAAVSTRIEQPLHFDLQTS